MNKLIKVLTFLSITFFLASCVQTPEVKKNSRSKLAISSVRDSPLSYPQGSVFSLAPKYSAVTSLKPEQNQVIYQVYMDAITHNLANNGFVKANDVKQAVFYVGFGLALSQDVPDELLNEKFGVSPGLPEQGDLSKGSFLIYIEDAKTGKRVWRGIVQGFAHENVSKAQRQQRAEAIVASVMKQFYQTN